MLDTSTVFDEYFCDFDRYIALNQDTHEIRCTYEGVYTETDASIETARSDAKACDLFHANGGDESDIGRFGIDLEYDY